MQSKLVLTLTAALFAASLFPPTARGDDRLIAQAMQAYMQKDYARSADLFARAFESGEPEAGDLYNAACAASLAGRVSGALDLLERSVQAGFIGADHLEKDTDLEPLHADPRWASIVASAKRNGEREARLWGTPALAAPWAEDLPVEVKIAGLSKLWSEARYNFANFDLVPELDWDAVYLEAIPRVTASKSTLEYYRILQEVVARLQDGHSNVHPPMAQLDRVYAKPALRTRRVDGSVILVEVRDESLRKAGLAPGDEILAIDGVPVHDYARARVQPWQGASTPQDLAARTYDYNLLVGAAGTAVKLSVRKEDGRTLDVDAARVAWNDPSAVRPPFQLRMLPGGIAHVVLNTFGTDQAATEFDAHRDEILAARGVIFDVRENGGGNSSVGYRILQHFNAEERVVSRWSTRQYRAAYRAWQRPHGVVTGTSSVAASANPYKGPVVLLTSARTYSAAEDFAVAFRGIGAGTIVGEATGGSTGQPVSFGLPGGGSGRVCAKRDVFADGTEFVGVGIRPDIEAAPKRADVAAGRDPVLERALALIAGKTIAR